VFQPTRRGLQISDPAAYQAALDADVVSWTAQYDVSEAEARQMLETDHVLSQPLGGWPPSEELGERIRRKRSTATTELLPTYYGTSVTAVHELLRWIIE
jgi:hypothetical protein